MTISLLMSVYNHKQYVREAIESILAQTYHDFEFIIVDDGSTDGTSDIIASMAKKDTRVHIITNETNIGLTQSLNNALSQTRGQFIGRMDADDVALPRRFEKEMEFLTQNPDIDVVGTAYEWIDENGVVLGKKTVPTTNKELHDILIKTNPFLHGSIIIRKEVLDQVNGYNTFYKKAQDYDLWLRLSHNHKFANLPESLMQKRMTKNMISFQSERTQIRFALWARLAAIKRGDYPVWCFIFLLKPFLATLLPIKFVRFLRVHIFGQKIYAHKTLRG